VSRGCRPWIYRHRRERLRPGGGATAAPGITRRRSRTAPGAPAAADRQFSDLELRERLEKAIARLPPNQRLLVAAHYLEGIQYEISRRR
jgi:DNA-directed RNA polymerase specialized sigma24 family protein